MFAIIGAAGKVGYSTSLALRKAGVQVRAVLRDETKANRLRDIGCEIALADVQDPVAIGRAIANADAVQVILPPPLQAEDALGAMQRIIASLGEALEEACPQRVLAISDYGAHVREDIGMPSVFRIFEERLRRLPMPKVFLRSAEHMEGWGAFIPGAIASGSLPSLHQPIDLTFPTVSAANVGLIAAELLLRPSTGTDLQIVHAEGPHRYSAADVAAALSQLLGRTITARALPRSQWQAGLERLLSPSAAELVIDLYDAHNEGGLVDVEPNQGEVRRGDTELIEALRPLVPPAAQAGPTEENETTALALVREFFHATVATPDGFWNSFETYFDDTTVWENVGVARTVGPNEAANFARAFPVDFDHMRIEDLVLSGAGNRVYAERLDHFCAHDGTIILTVRALGVLEVKGRKIAHWRDYFDTAGFAAALGRQSA